MDPYSVVASQSWERDDGLRASIYGACPWPCESERSRWRVVNNGWTTFDARSNTVGGGRKPFANREDAQALCDRWNAELAERMAFAASLRAVASEGGAR